ncbi:hypothetical protein [Mycobacterium sp. EPa45]|uniref:hypothetical protein n=1 Tax=Mycobacterium sp. EPa45 TaxID=1545728 RepID=UPI000641EE3E|nr:hypothetical protein [Mycobacterium sp. EPa45]AKK26103.1 hypothetical protein AB431_04640 [Mycobacterium sp. EPa45]
MGQVQQGRYIGRVGALAVALGVGGLIVALPAAAGADTGAGDSGKTTSSAGKHAPRNAAKPRASKAPTATATATVKPAASRAALDRLNGGEDPLAPVTEPLSFAVLAVTRRDGSARSARSVTTSGTASAAAASVPSGSSAASVSQPAGATAGTVLGTAVRNFIDTHLPGWSPIADQLAPIVADGLQDLLTNGAVSAEVQRLVANDAIRQFVSAKISAALNTYLGVPTSVGTVVGNAAVSFAGTVLGTAGVQTALDVLAAGVKPDSAQVTAILTAAAAGDVAPLANYFTSVVTNSTDEIATFLNNSAVRGALASGIAGAVVDLTNGGVIPTWLGNVVDGWVTSALGGGATATAVGNALGTAVQGLLSNTKAVQGVATVAGAAVSNLLAAPGVTAALADYITQFGTALVAGESWIDALDVAWQGLQVNSAFLSALGPVAGDAVASLATNADVVAALASTAKTLVINLAADAGFRAVVGELFGPQYGPTLAQALADPASAAQLGATVGSVLTNFLGQDGVTDALAAATEQIVTALLSGMSPVFAVQNVIQSLASNPAVVAAFNATVPDALKGVLQAPAVRGVISTVAQGVVAQLIDTTPLNNTVLDPVVSQVAKAAVDAFVANPAAQGLIGDLAGDLLDGTPPADVVQTVISKVVTSPALQIALGQALGQAFGALLGDNPVSFAVGQLAGIGTALVLVLGFGAANLFGLTGALTASSVPSGSSYFVTLQIA